VCAVAIALLPGAGGAWAQTGAAAAIPAAAVPVVSVLTQAADGTRTVRATRISEPIAVDGRLDERIYGLVPPLTEFVQQEPTFGAPVSERTEVWVLFDDRQIYIACRCSDTPPERIVANDMRRDSVNLRLNDSFTVALDTFHDRRDGVTFGITPLGAVWDTVMSEIRPPSMDWNTIWTGEAARFEGGWVAEMAIPYKSLRYRAGREQTWGLQLRRVLPAKNEIAYISPVSPAWGTNGLNNVSAAATLVGIEVPAAGRNLEIKPYAISQVTTDLVRRPASRNRIDSDAGLDLKSGITYYLTADFTYNPDFAHVEAE
jgi:hypothetical protein